MHRVLFVETGIVGGGSFESLYQTLRHLDRSRFAPLVAFLNRTKYLELVRGLDIPVFLLTDLAYTKSLPRFLHRRVEKAADRALLRGTLGGERLFRFCHGLLLRSLRRIIREQRVDLLYLNTQINRDLFGCLAAREAGIPLVSHQRSMDGATFAGPKVALANAMVAAYISNSSVTKAYWEGRGIDAAKSHLVFNAVPDETLPPADPRAVFAIAPGDALVGCVARLVGFKNHGLLLEAFADLLVRRPHTSLLLLGDGPERESLERRCRELGIAGRVIFAGFREDARSLMAGLDVLALPSRGEPFGRVLIEAMQAGVPVIGADSGGIPDIIEHGRNGLLLPLDDVPAWTAALERLLDDAALRTRLVAGGRESVATTFNLHHCTAQLEGVLEGVLAGAAGKALPGNGPE